MCVVALTSETRCRCETPILCLSVVTLHWLERAANRAPHARYLLPAPPYLLPLIFPSRWAVRICACPSSLFVLNDQRADPGGCCYASRTPFLTCRCCCSLSLCACSLATWIVTAPRDCIGGCATHWEGCTCAQRWRTPHGEATQSSRFFFYSLSALSTFILQVGLTGCTDGWAPESFRSCGRTWCPPPRL